MEFQNVVCQCGVAIFGLARAPSFFFSGRATFDVRKSSKNAQAWRQGKHRSVHARVLKANTSRQKAREEIRKRTLVESSPNLLACCIECERGMAALFSSPSSYTSRGAARNPASAPTPVPRAEADLSVGMADTACCGVVCVVFARELRVFRV